MMLYSSLNFNIIRRDNSLFLYDSAEFYNYGLKLHKGLLSPQMKDKFRAMADFWYGGTWHKPPMVMVFTAPFYLLFGPSRYAAQVSNIFFLAVMAFSVYFIGERLRGRMAGFAAACLLLTFPMIMGQSRIYWLDFPLTCWTALAVCLLLYSDYFKSRRFSVLFGVALGIGCLVKQTLPVFILGPFAAIAYYSLREERSRIKNLLASLGIAAAIVLSWYIPNLKMKLTYFMMVPADASLNAAGMHSVLPPAIDRLAFHLAVLKTIMLHQFYFYAFIFCLICFLVFKKKKDELVLLLWIIVPYLFFSLVPLPRSARYTMPVLPAIALMISCVIDRIPAVRPRMFFYIVTIVLGVIQAAYLHSGPGYSGLAYYLGSFDREGIIKPYEQDWKADEIISIVLQGTGGRHARVALLPDLPPLSAELAHRSISGNTGTEIVLPTLTPVVGYYKEMDLYRKMISRRDYITGFDYIILVSDGNGFQELLLTQPEAEKELFDILKMNFEKNIRAFSFSGKTELPYGLKALIYKRTDHNAFK